MHQASILFPGEHLVWISHLYWKLTLWLGRNVAVCTFDWFICCGGASYPVVQITVAITAAITLLVHWYVLNSRWEVSCHDLCLASLFTEYTSVSIGFWVLCHTDTPLQLPTIPGFSQAQSLLWPSYGWVRIITVILWLLSNARFCQWPLVVCIWRQ